MGHRREDVVAHALHVLDTYGLADLTMRRLGAELDVRASALYHHFPNKQALLAAVADEILVRGRPAHVEGSWEDRVVATCAHLRDAMLAWTDGADVVATAYAFGLGASQPYAALVDALAETGLSPAETRTAARTLLHFVFGHTHEEQMHLQAVAAGALEDDPGEGSDFALALDLVVSGIRAHLGVPSRP